MFQIVYKTSSINTGYRLLPLTLSVPIGSAVFAILMSKYHVPPFYLIPVGSILQTPGIGLMIWLPTSSAEFPDPVYGFATICGFGVGVSTTVSILTAMLVFEKEDLCMPTLCWNKISSLTSNSSRYGLVWPVSLSWRMRWSFCVHQYHE